MAWTEWLAQAAQHGHWAGPGAPGPMRGGAVPETWGTAPARPRLTGSGKAGAAALPRRAARESTQPRDQTWAVRRRGRRLATALLAAGLLSLLGGTSALLYAPWREQEHLAQRPAGPHEELPARWEAPAEELPARREAPGVDGADRGVHLAAAKALGEGAEWIAVPRIGVDSPVMEMGLQGGEYQVPSFDVGHHADSANPGQPGNSIYNGHLQTINAGEVFGRLHELRPGDVVYVYTASYRFDWVVDDTHTVRNDDRAFLQPTAEPRLTLYTCAGTYDLRTRDYTHRRVVVGRLAQVVPREHPSATHS
jgi:LPXTG-site transpeptidase (sortase) family protein